MISTKLLRLPTRGALGNGLRVVVGAVLASEGSLVVTTRNRRLVLAPNPRDGSTTVVEDTEVDHPVGTRVEIGFGPALPRDENTLQWANEAIRMAAHGRTYDGKTSPWWYDPTTFHELLIASGALPVREPDRALRRLHRGQGWRDRRGGRARRTTCENVTREAGRAPARGRPREHPAGEAEAARSGGPGGLPRPRLRDRARDRPFGSSAPLAEVPFVVEAWAVD